MNKEKKIYWDVIAIFKTVSLWSRFSQGKTDKCKKTPGAITGQRDQLSCRLGELLAKLKTQIKKVVLITGKVNSQSTQADPIPTGACNLPTEVCVPPDEVCDPPAEVCVPPAEACNLPTEVCGPPAEVCVPPAEVSVPPIEVCPLPAEVSDPPARVCALPTEVYDLTGKAMIFISIFIINRKFTSIVKINFNNKGE
ncbi:MAG TPA: hypothetical protein VK469_03775 [Candidatus Kapabacteria bacterium]|nr:hypothetical protein [Candidatus Kapabacteria bacterium]